MKLNENDKIRQHATQQIRSYFQIDYKNFNEQFKINFQDYFSKEIKYLDEMVKDGLLTINNQGIYLSEIGKDFVQNIMNVFDSYDPPWKSYKERLTTIKNAKDKQRDVQEQI